MVNYEIALRTNNTKKLQLQDILKAIDNPGAVSDENDKQRMQQIKLELEQKRDQGNIHAKLILLAAQQANNEKSVDNNPVS